MFETRRSTSKLVGSLLGHAALALLALAATPSCGGGSGSAFSSSSSTQPDCTSDPKAAGCAGAVCSIANDTGCPADQTCLADSAGKPACFCSTKTGKGCADGKVCLADSKGVPACFCSTATNAGCDKGKVCEEVPGAQPACFAPVTLGGSVFDLATGAAIAGARVVARDANFAAVSGVATTDAAGKYALPVPTPRKADGTPLELEVFLRADAAGHVTFPTAPRVALPIDVAKAAGDPPHLESSATRIGMLPLASADALGTVSGKVLADAPRGTLVVAGRATGIADADGTYTVFNVPVGTATVRGYKVGLELGEATAKVAAGAETKGVDLAAKGAATAVVSGKVNLVNPGQGTTTSVVLVVEETFDAKAARGEAPPGLRVGGVSSGFSLAGVPNGSYAVLAAFENDLLVRDPDVAQGGTDIVHIVVNGGSVALPDEFKVTGALDVVSPDHEEVVSGTPMFVWADDSGEDHYELYVFDAYGTEVWKKLDVPGETKKTVEVAYGGPPLESGRMYQFRAISIKKGGAPISTTEDLRGVFVAK